MNLKALFCLLTAVKFSNSENLEKSKPKPTPFEDWDYLVFSQRWPVTTCEQWQEVKANNSCNVPNNPVIWTIHGIWPTKIGKDGPYFCNSAIHFDPTLLAPIEADLNKYWVNVEANTKNYSFWKHEWDKHGTCASSSPDFNGVEKYFKQGLVWNQQYNIGLILSKSNITPSNNGYTIEQVYNSVVSVLNKKPRLQCVVDSHSKQSLINEMRLCFNKSLELIDCDVDSSNFNDDFNTNCNLNKPIMYFNTVPMPAAEITTTSNSVWEIDFDNDWVQYTNEAAAYNTYTMKLITLHKILQFLIWFTL